MWVQTRPPFLRIRPRSHKVRMSTRLVCKTQSPKMRDNRQWNGVIKMVRPGMRAQRPTKSTLDTSIRILAGQMCPTRTRRRIRIPTRAPTPIKTRSRTRKRTSISSLPRCLKRLRIRKLATIILRLKLILQCPMAEAVSNKSIRICHPKTVSLRTPHESMINSQ